MMHALAARLDRLTRIVAVILMLSLLACVVIGVVSRQFNRPVIWSDEMAQYLMVWTGFIGWIIASRRRNHIRISVFIDRLPRSARLAAEILIQLSIVGFAAALLHYGWPLVGRNWDVEWVSLPLPSGLLYVPILFAALVLIGQALVEIMMALRGEIAQDPTPGAQPL